MIVTRGLGRGPRRGSIVAAGLTRRSRIEVILDSLKLIAGAPSTAAFASAIALSEATGPMTFARAFARTMYSQLGEPMAGTTSEGPLNGVTTPPE